ncbi:2CS histidine protein kinase [Bifidobacterium ramosum]|uniref:2CS histidine protein kinase n=1 Tax=Bifidobacterium ramosum TaxID=1798158 RepID=A0A6L4WY30_9BIFI|nr:2CS histidine protein kinase [Bifidobacterium ramosum]KAB8286968.1 2CS histidine protein kinase [Bifidobacterium ramosum]NEG72524.1 2CS histidine protein kinase [Bifidobacterium ramosum]
MTGWLDRLADADRRTGNAWLLTAVLIVALVCAAETLTRLTDGDMGAVDAMCAFGLVWAVVLMAFRPVSGGLLTAMTWTVLCVAPVETPSAALVAVLVAVGVLGYANRRIAALVALMTLAAWLFTAGGVALPQWHVGSGGGTGSSMSTNADDDAAGDAGDTTDADSAGSSADSLGSADDTTDANGTDDARREPSNESSNGDADASDHTDTITGDHAATDGTASAGDGDVNGAGDGDRRGDDRHVLLGTVAMSGVIPVIVLFAGFLLGGMAARWNHERHSERMELAYRRQRARAAQDIHDYVSNDLAYLILRLDKDIADGKSPGVEELRELRDVASGALDRTHQVIGVIEGRDGGHRAAEMNGRAEAVASASVPLIDDRTSDDLGLASSSVSHHARRSSGSSVVNPNAERDDCPLAAQLRTIAHAGDHRLAELGFDGQTIITNANDGAEPDELIEGFLEELYGNIAKHADPAAGYVLTIGIGRDAVQVALVDTAVNSVAASGRDSDAPRLGTGLNRYRTRLDARDGALTIDAQDGEWTLSAVIPLR